MSQFAAIEACIRQLHARYTDAVWRKDADAFGSCFSEDAQWRIAGRVFHGRGEIAAGFAQVAASAGRILLTFRTPQLEMTGRGRAGGRVYVTEQCTWRDRPPSTSIGRYFEHYVDEGDCWRFSWRLFQLFYYGPADLTGDFFEPRDFGAFPRMPPLDLIPEDFTGRFARETE
ncbi:nuclear transport factor 2 family protein [Novosphingobium album (ex Liu et al. 2023)]|uniref:Nuclear transport factor 2 family protein n=1 Tax=Novosphingobium album (ex Liu et al. 2023) TaxID=3031130 RepID=A0ABT5WN06_9SPHN|nr:nuclear transport factor 2 family protein [Novosphingobium album (ex Liu et al. 2023)]MDE8651420.1 nuclear transport factor 2 family protein [Novosphingobium album (ex Liu et al. 2023)]